MDAFTAIMTRGSIREFSDKPISKEDIIKILEAGIHAPSSKNAQPWFFLVDTTQKKNKIAELVEQYADETFTPQDPRTGKSARPATALASAHIVRHAPVVILAFCDSPFTGGRKELLKKPELKYLLAYTSEVQSIAAAAQNMLLAAHSIGLGAVWNNDIYYIAEDIQRLYNIPHDFILALCIGYPKEQIQRNPVRLKKYRWV